MSYTHKYVETVGYCIMTFGGVFLLVKQFQGSPVANFLGSAALIAGVAGPIALWINNREKHV